MAGMLSIYNQLPQEIIYKILSHLPVSKLLELNLSNKLYWEIARLNKRGTMWNNQVDWSLKLCPSYLFNTTNYLHCYTLSDLVKISVRVKTPENSPVFLKKTKRGYFVTTREGSSLPLWKDWYATISSNSIPWGVPMSDRRKDQVLAGPEYYVGNNYEEKAIHLVPVKEQVIAIYKQFYSMDSFENVRHNKIITRPFPPCLFFSNTHIDVSVLGIKLLNPRIYRGTVVADIHREKGPVKERIGVVLMQNKFYSSWIDNMALTLFRERKNETFYAVGHCLSDYPESRPTKPYDRLMREFLYEPDYN